MLLIYAGFFAIYSPVLSIPAVCLCLFGMGLVHSDNEPVSNVGLLVVIAAVYLFYLSSTI